MKSMIGGGFGVEGTWLQLVCCAVLCHHVPNFGDDFISEDRSQTRTTRRFQVVEQDGGCSD